MGRNRRTLDLRGQLFTEKVPAGQHRHGVGKRRQGKKKALHSTKGSKEIVGLSCARVREMGGGCGEGGEWSCARLRVWNKRGLTRSQDISLYPSARAQGLVSPEESLAPATLEDNGSMVSSQKEIQQHGLERVASLEKEHTPPPFHNSEAPADNQEGISGGQLDPNPLEPPAASECATLKGNDSRSLNDISSLLSSMSMDENASDIDHTPLPKDHTHLSTDHTSHVDGSGSKDTPLYEVTDPTRIPIPGSKNHTHISEDSDSTHLSEDTDLTNLSMFEVPYECGASDGASKEQHYSNGEDSDVIQISQLEGYRDEFHSDITDLSLDRAQQDGERSDAEICQGNLSLMNGFSEIAVACNGRVFKPTSFSTPFRKAQCSTMDSVTHLTAQCNTSHERTMDSTQEWKRGSNFASEMESDFTRLDFSSQQLSTNLDPPNFVDSDLTQLDSKCHESPMQVGTPHGLPHIPASAKRSILKHRYPIFYGSTRKNLSKSVTFKLPTDSCDTSRSSIYSCDRSGGLVDRMGQS